MFWETHNIWYSHDSFVHSLGIPWHWHCFSTLLVELQVPSIWQHLNQSNLSSITTALKSCPLSTYVLVDFYKLQHPVKHIPSFTAERLLISEHLYSLPTVSADCNTQHEGKNVHTMENRTHFISNFRLNYCNGYNDSLDNWWSASTNVVI